MPNTELATATVAIPVWVVASAAALFVFIGVLTLTRAGSGVARAALRVVSVVIACVVAVLWFSQASLHERTAERRALDERVSALDARAIAPGSALACLDARAGDAVESACEKAVFATPQSVAEAVVYVSARLALLADATDFARRTGGGYESGLATLRSAIESDRFGIVAHVLSVRDSCTPLLCDSYVLMHDSDRVQANLRERLFDHYIERYAAEWASHPQPPQAEAAGNPATTASMAPAAPTPASPSKYEFPSAASIPPVSIMTTEPPAPPAAKAEAKPASKPDAKAEAKAGSKPDAKAEAKAGSKPETKSGAAKRPSQQGAQSAHASARAAAAGAPQPQPQPSAPPPSAPAAAH